MGFTGWLPYSIQKSVGYYYSPTLKTCFLINYAVLTKIQVAECPPPTEQGGNVSPLDRGIVLLGCIEHLYTPLTVHF